VTKVDKAPAYAIAWGECTEACAAIASVCGATSAARYAAVVAIACALDAMLTALVR
jgi:hypothetical protein